MLVRSSIMALQERHIMNRLSIQERSRILAEIDALKLMDNLRPRLANRVQLTTDGHKAYLVAVNETFGADVDYAMLVKLYAEPKGQGNERRYSAGECCGTRRRRIVGNPIKGDISTSHVERQNLTMRMSMRRFTRLTNAFSKKLENLGHAVALHFMHYNYARIHQSLRVTPAMEAGISDRVWSLEEIAALADQSVKLEATISEAN
jgi:hypothetical protein